MTRRLVLNLALTASLLSLGSAKADTMTFNLTDGNVPGLSGFTGPFASVLVNRTDTTHATITFTSLQSTSGNAACTPATPCTYRLGGQGTAGVNVNSTTWTATALSSNGSGALTNAGAGNEDGWGSFNQTIDTFDGFNSSSTTVSFVLTNTSGTWAAASNVLVANASGHLAAAHIFVAGAACTDAGAPAACTTGFAADGGGGGPQGSVPEPTSIVLLGGIVAFTARAIQRRRVA